MQAVQDTQRGKYNRLGKTGAVTAQSLQSILREIKSWINTDDMHGP